MTAAGWNEFKGKALPLEDIDLPRIGHRIKVGEDELHAFMDVETSGSGFDAQGRPKMLFEPHVFYRNLSGAKRARAVKEGLAYKDWKPGAYPKDSYPRLVKAMAIDETAALKASSLGLGQVLGENHKMVNFATPQDMMRAFMDDEETHLEAMVQFIVAAGIDDEMRALAALTRKTTAADCEKIVRVYNGPGYKKNRYHIKMAAAHNKWRAIKDTPWSPAGDSESAVAQPVDVQTPAKKPVAVSEADLIKQVQDLLWDKGYPEVGEPDGKFGSRTRNAILAFQADNELPLTGKVTDDLLAHLVKAPKREMAHARQTATAKDLQAEPVVQEVSGLKKIGGAIIAISGLGGLLDGTGSLDDLVGGVGKVRELIDTLGPYLPWLVVALGGYAVLHYGQRTIAKYVEAYREGRAL